MGTGTLESVSVRAVRSPPKGKAEPAPRRLAKLSGPPDRGGRNDAPLWSVDVPVRGLMI